MLCGLITIHFSNATLRSQKQVESHCKTEVGMKKFVCWHNQDEDAKKAVVDMWKASGGVASQMNVTHAPDGTPLAPTRKELMRKFRNTVRLA
jgi:hypothetical protein